MISLIVAGLLFAVVRPTLARLVGGSTGLTEFLAANNVEVGSEVVDGYHQIYYIFEGKKTFITEGGLNATSPVSVGEYIAYRRNAGTGTDYIFLYHIPTNTTVQLSGTGNNGNPRVSRDGKVVWERWQAGGWQIFLFDGVRVRQLTEGELSTNPEIEGDLVTYSRKDAAGITRKDTYAIPSSESTTTPPTVTPEEIAQELGSNL